MLVASFRTFVRWRYRKLSWLDDGFLAFAVVLLVVSLGLWFAMLDNLYKTEALIYDPLGSLVLFNNIVQIAIDVQTYTSVYIAISITGIFAIKFSFLFFFRSLISRLRPMVIYWRIAVAYTALAWAISVAISFVACPYFDSRAVQCAQDDMLARALDVSIVLLVFDVTSDAMIISIPVLVIARVRIPLRSKIYLACTFCLSTIMIICAILQGATLETEGVNAIDVVWQIYFQMVEICLAVTVVSLTAFRTFFVQRGSRNNTPRSPQNPKWYSYKKWKKSVSDRTTSTGFTGYSDEIQLPTVDQRAEGPVPDPPANPSPSKETDAGEDVRSPSLPPDVEKGTLFPKSPPPTYAKEEVLSPGPAIPKSVAAGPSTPVAPEIRIPILPQIRNYEPPAPPPPPSPHSDGSAESSPFGISMPIQGSEDSPASLTPLHTPLPAAALTDETSQHEQQDHLQPTSPELRPQLLPTHSHTSASLSASAAVTSWSPPTLRPPRSSSPAQRTALKGPPSAHTSRTDSLQPGGRGSVPTSSDGPSPIPDVPPLPSPLPAAHLPQSQQQPDSHSQPLSSQPSAPPASRTHSASDFSRGVPPRKPLPPSPTTTHILSPTGPTSTAPTVTSPHIQSQIQSPQQARGRGFRFPGQRPPIPPTPGSTRSTATAGTAGTVPRTPRSNLSPDLRVSGVQRAIRSGIERAMSLEPAGEGRGERW